MKCQNSRVIRFTIDFWGFIWVQNFVLLDVPSLINAVIALLLLYDSRNLTKVDFRFVFARLTKSDFQEPVNIGSDEMVSMNEMAEIVLSFGDKKLPIHHIPGPEGVRGRNSDNTLIKEKLGWAPTMRLKVRHSLFFQDLSSFHDSSVRLVMQYIPSLPLVRVGWSLTLLRAW